MTSMGGLGSSLMALVVRELVAKYNSGHFQACCCGRLLEIARQCRMTLYTNFRCYVNFSNSGSLQHLQTMHEQRAHWCACVCVRACVCVCVCVYVCVYVCAGWDEGCLTMHQGEVAKLYIAGHKGYGAQGFSSWGYP